MELWCSSWLVMVGKCTYYLTVSCYISRNCMMTLLIICHFHELCVTTPSNLIALYFKAIVCWHALYDGMHWWLFIILISWFAPEVSFAREVDMRSAGRSLQTSAALRQWCWVEFHPASNMAIGSERVNDWWTGRCFHIYIHIDIEEHTPICLLRNYSLRSGRMNEFCVCGITCWYRVEIFKNKADTGWRFGRCWMQTLWRSKKWPTHLY